MSAVSPPEVPVIVRVNDPVAAAFEATSVNVLGEPAMIVWGAKVAVTPAGKPLALKVAVPLKPAGSADGVRSRLIMIEPLEPWLTVKVAGLADRVKAGLTLSSMVVDCVREPLVPVTVTIAASGGAVPDAVNVSTLPDVVGFVSNDAVTPVGRPLTLKFTDPVNPLLGVTVIVLEPLPPGPMITVSGLADREKAGVIELTVSAMLAV